MQKLHYTEWNVLLQKSKKLCLNFAYGIISVIRLYVAMNSDYLQGTERNKAMGEEFCRIYFSVLCLCLLKEYRIRLSHAFPPSIKTFSWKFYQLLRWLVESLIMNNRSRSFFSCSSWKKKSFCFHGYEITNKLYLYPKKCSALYHVRYMYIKTWTFYHKV